MTRIQGYIADYGDNHQTLGNEVCHIIGIPVITLALLGLLAQVPIAGIDGGILLLVFGMGLYLFLEWRLGAIMIVLATAMYWGAVRTPMAWLVGLQVGGWVLQFVGHGYYEKRSPAFLKNLLHIMIGPLWLLNRVVGIVSAPERA